MGNLMRQYWVPALPASEFPTPDSPPKRMRLLGENLVMFRDTAGAVGCFVEACPHRGASLFFGRNEEAGLRCVYHGWKFDTTGQCVDMPSEPAESNFKTKIRATAYPCRDINHMVWIYMGPRETPPSFPRFEVLTLPAEQVNEPSIMMEEANWFQNLEGDIDSSHIDYLHSRARDAFALSGGYLPPTSDPRSRYFTTANKSNDYNRDFEVERTTQFCGIPFAGNLQDRAMTELMCNEDGIEPIYDRSKEHLGTTDSMVIFTRRCLLRAAKALRDEGRLPANVENSNLDAVRSASIVLPTGADWPKAT